MPAGLLRRGIVVVGLAVGLMACGQNGDDASSTTATTPDTIEVTMTDFAFEPSDLTVPAEQEVTLQFTNAGNEEHYFVVGDTVVAGEDEFRQNLFQNVSLDKSKQTDGPEEGHDEDEEEGDHHENEFELPPGGSGSITFTLPASKAGTYTIACFETTGDQTHRELGMQGTLTVTASDEN